MIRNHLGRQKVKAWTRLVPPSLALAYTLFFNGMMAVEQFGSSVGMRDGLMILGVSVYGAAILLSVGYLHVLLAKSCGWQFVARGRKKC
jgi:hypothetical protein